MYYFFIGLLSLPPLKWLCAKIDQAVFPPKKKFSEIFWRNFILMLLDGQ